MPKAHAVLSPSGAHRWLNCTPSARLELRFPDKTSAAADEGTLAHALGELLIRKQLNLITKAKYSAEFKKIEANQYYDNAMQEYAENYAVYVLERYAEAQQHTKDALLFLERKIDLTYFIPEGFGTGDAFIIADGVLDFIDLKYGKGVPVSAVNNSQMKVYALGALREFELSYDIHTVRMTIYQPRLDSISTWEISVADLNAWAENELKPKAELAFKGEGEYIPGSHCQFCRARAVCKANADFNLGIAKYDFEVANLLKDEDITDILNRSAAFKSWLADVEEYVLVEAINGKKWPGYKLVEGRSNRQYMDEAAVAETLLKEGYKEDSIYTPKKLLGITAMEKSIGKKPFALHLTSLIVKPPGKPTLVPDSDSRPEINSTESAVSDFEHIDI